jgi:hypothetical protein
MNLRAVTVTTLGFLAIFSGAGHADPREDLLQAINKCAAVADDKARLGCYDAAAPHLHDVLNVPPPALTSPPTKEEEKSWFGFDLGGLFGGSAPTQTTPQQFGSESTPQVQQKVESARQEVDSITAGVTEYSFTLTKKFIVFLDNGQVWRQVPGDSDEAHFHGAATDNKVTITRGAFSSYSLQINDGNQVFKVTRVK